MALVRNGIAAGTLARQLGISDTLLRNWVAGPASSRARFRRLRIVAPPAADQVAVRLISPRGFAVAGLTLALAAERSLRAPVMGRNNYHGFRTLDGADIGMTYFSLIESCKLMWLTPESYLRELAHRSCRGEPLETPYAYAKRIRAA